MRTTDDDGTSVSIAQQISQASDRDLARTVSRLRASKRLFSTVHELNQLLSMPQHKAVAMQALKRLGLDRAG